MSSQALNSNSTSHGRGHLIEAPGTPCASLWGVPVATHELGDILSLHLGAARHLHIHGHSMPVASSTRYHQGDGSASSLGPVSMGKEQRAVRSAGLIVVVEGSRMARARCQGGTVHQCSRMRLRKKKILDPLSPHLSIFCVNAISTSRFVVVI